MLQNFDAIEVSYDKENLNTRFISYHTLVVNMQIIMQTVYIICKWILNIFLNIHVYVHVSY